jgi:hypothetical protein
MQMGDSLCYPPTTIQCRHDATLHRQRQIACIGPQPGASFVHAPGADTIRATCRFVLRP